LMGKHWYSDKSEIDQKTDGKIEITFKE
jgi:hypothetical protein